MLSFALMLSAVYAEYRYAECHGAVMKTVADFEENIILWQNLIRQEGKPSMTKSDKERKYNPSPE